MTRLNDLLPKLAGETGIAAQARMFSAWSQVAAMVYAQISHPVRLNEMRDALRLPSVLLVAWRFHATMMSGPTPQSVTNPLKRDP